MSLKPVKKSDQNKSWMQPRRDRRKMIQPEYHLIVTEGTKTEPPYPAFAIGIYISFFANLFVSIVFLNTI